MSNKSRWDPARWDPDHLIRLLDEGRSLAEVGKMFGVSQQRIAQIVGPLGRTWSRFPRKALLIKSRKKEIVVRVRAGESYRSICKDLQVDDTTLRRVISGRWKVAPPAADRHGTASCYINRGCRCRACTRANSVKSYAYYLSHKKRNAK